MGGLIPLGNPSRPLGHKKMDVGISTWWHSLMKFSTRKCKNKDAIGDNALISDREKFNRVFLYL